MSDIQFDRGYVNAQEAAAGRFGGGGSSAPAEGDFGFDDFLDIINPLQHIPIVSTLYREITGDEISAPARMFGGTLFGGPSGFVSAMFNTVFDEVAGRDLGSSVMALFRGDDAADPQIAQPAEGALTGAALTEDQAKALAAVPLITASGSPLAPTALSSAAPQAAPQREATAPQATTADASANQPGDSGAPPTAPQPGDAGGLLTGQDALNALFHDLRGTGTVVPGQEPPTAPPRRASPTRRDDAAPAEHQQSQQTAAPATDPASNPLILAAQAPDAALADKMLSALDKYRAMNQRQRNSTPEDAAAGSNLPPFRPPPPL